MTIHHALAGAVQALASAGVPDAPLDAALLLSHVCGIPRLSLPLCSAQELTLQQEQHFASLLLSRASREPLQYLLGEQGFYGLTLAVDDRALIPRPETETLCELALSFLSRLAAPRALDLCTGSGAIAMALKHECPAAQVTATDVSPDALALARENAERLGLPIRFLQGDLWSPVPKERFDLIVSNPPYIESEACKTLQAEVLREPLLALDGGADGLRFYRAIAAGAASRLQPGGLLCVEIGDTQASQVCELFAAQEGFAAPTVHADLSGKDRVVCVHRASFPT